MGPRAAARSTSLLLAAAVAAWTSGCSGDSEGNQPGTTLRTRLEAHLADIRPRLERHPDHLGLIESVDSARLVEALAHVRYFEAGRDIALGSRSGVEPHGGGVLALLIDHWRPEGRPTRLDDRFFFQPNQQRLALLRIYDSHKRQVYLPDTDLLPRMSFRLSSRSEPMDRDAYAFLATLLRLEDDPSATWTNHRDQSLSVDALMESVWTEFSRLEPLERAPDDHSSLHLVPLLLAHGERSARAVPPDAIKDRFLELALATPVEATATEVLAHHAEALGRLLSDRAVDWPTEDRLRLRSWLARLEQTRFLELDRVAPQHLCHLLLGLRLVAENRDLLEIP